MKLFLLSATGRAGSTFRPPRLTGDGGITNITLALDMRLRRNRSLAALSPDLSSQKSNEITLCVPSWAFQPRRKDYGSAQQHEQTARAFT
jgi:hypothetical protein